MISSTRAYQRQMVPRKAPPWIAKTCRNGWKTERSARASFIKWFGKRKNNSRSKRRMGCVGQLTRPFSVPSWPMSTWPRSSSSLLRSSQIGRAVRVPRQRRLTNITRNGTFAKLCRFRPSKSFISFKPSKASLQDYMDLLKTRTLHDTFAKRGNLSTLSKRRSSLSSAVSVNLDWSS